MSLENVKKFFLDRGLEDPTFILDESGATVDLAAKTIGIEPHLVAKTLALHVKEKNILIVVRGDARIDNKKFKQRFNTKARMLAFEEVEAAIGHPVGGVCPFGINDNVEVYVDESIKNFEYVYPAAGSKSSALKIEPGKILELTNASWVDVCTY